MIDFEKLYDSDLVIKKADRHLVDYTDHLFKNDIQGTPYFLLFDPDGKLVFKQLGYSSKQSDLLKDEITRIIDL
ncbi:MAG: hypothetical protein IPM42_11455 [Saprospiraceae bacterium]|nr:hypothetical protein [Saprospiraceae bacterium]